MMKILELLASIIIPLIMTAAALLMFSKKKNYFDIFTDGAKSGMQTTIQLLPAMLALSVALSMLSASGFVECMSEWLSPISEKIGVPIDILPLLITRPVSGSASTATYAKLIERLGSDNFAVMCATVIMGSSDTIIYISAVYFSSAGIKRTRHTIPVAVFIMFLCIFLSCFICRIFFPLEAAAM